MGPYFFTTTTTTKTTEKRQTALQMPLPHVNLALKIMLVQRRTKIHSSAHYEQYSTRFVYGSSS